jgi:hypothetical protein
MEKVVHIMHILIIAKVMCTYCTSSLFQKLCAHTAHALYVRSYVHIPHTHSLLQKLCYTLHCYVHKLHTSIVAKVLCTYFLWKKLCAHAAILTGVKAMCTYCTHSLCQVMHMMHILVM